MSEPTLNKASLRLLMMALESPTAALSPAALRHYVAEAARLKGAALIKPAGHEQATTVRGDFSDAAVALTWSPEHGGYGYFCEAAGWTHVPHEELQTFAVDIIAFISALTRKLALSSKQANEIVPAHLWDLGGAYLGKRTKRTPILFGRRLHDQKSWRDIEAALRVRPSIQPRIMLTSTVEARLPPGPRPCALISIEGLLEPTGTLAINSDLLALQIDGSPMFDVSVPLAVVAEGREVRFYGEVFRFPKGVKQRQVICALFDHYQRGIRSVSSVEIAEEAGLGLNTRIRDLFKGHPGWGRLLTESDGMLGFCFPDHVGDSALD